MKEIDTFTCRLFDPIFTKSLFYRPFISSLDLVDIIRNENNRYLYIITDMIIVVIKWNVPIFSKFRNILYFHF